MGKIKISQLPKESGKVPINQLPTQEAEPEQPGRLEAGLRGAAQGATLETADEISGISETVYDFVSGRAGFSDFIDTYRKNVAESRANFEAAQQAHPGTFLAGQVGGSIAAAIATRGASLGAGLGARGFMAAGALEGAISGLGASEADLTKGEFIEAGKDVATGAALGAVTAGVSKGLANVAGKLAARQNLSPKAVAALFRKKGRVSAKKAFDQRANKNLERGIEGLQKRGIVPTNREQVLSQDMGELLQRVDSEGESIGSAIREVAQLADEFGTVPVKNIPNLKQTATSLRKVFGNREGSEIVSEIENSLTSSNLSHESLLDLRQAYDEVISRTSPKAKKLVKDLKQVRNSLKETLESSIAKAAKESDSIKQVFSERGVSSFQRLNESFADIAVTRDVIADAAALSASEAAEREVGQTVLEGFAQGAKTGGFGGGAVEAARSIPALESLGQAAIHASRKISRAGRVVTSEASQALSDTMANDLRLGQQLYQTFNPESFKISSDDDKRIYINDVLSNPSLSHSDKFRLMNQVQKTGRVDIRAINPERKEP